MLRIDIKQSANFISTNAKVQAYSIVTILKRLLNTQMEWMIFMQVLKNRIQIMPSMIVDMLCNKKLNPIVT